MIKLNKPSECEVIKIKLMSDKEAENFIKDSVFYMEVFYSPN